LLEQVALGPAVPGWPRRSHKATPADAPAPDRTALRTAVVCWPSEKGWPWPIAATDARATLEKANPCEWWLLAVKPDTGEPDPSGASFPIGLKPFSATAPQWAAAFDPSLPIEDTLLRQTATPQAAREPAPVREPEPAPALAPALARAPAPEPDPDPQPGRQPCGEAARSRSATLDRFDQWDRQIRSSPSPSLDRASFSLDAAAWSGHCQELDVLRAALERQLGCTAAVTGECAPVATP
ncbi:MAG TPA: hypothetical protein VFP52_15385, partial [Myxococcales bacterium]|nr:hypothetical protein [Myxococcales bacterium]